MYMRYTCTLTFDSSFAEVRRDAYSCATLCLNDCYITVLSYFTYYVTCVVSIVGECKAAISKADVPYTYSIIIICVFLFVDYWKSHLLFIYLIFIFYICDTVREMVPCGEGG